MTSVRRTKQVRKPVKRVRVVRATPAGPVWVSVLAKNLTLAERRVWKQQQAVTAR